MENTFEPKEMGLLIVINVKYKVRDRNFTLCKMIILKICNRMHIRSYHTDGSAHAKGVCVE